VMEGEGMGCWAIIVDHGRSSSGSGGSSSAVCACHSSVGARCCSWEAVSVVHGCRAVVCGRWGSLSVLGIVHGRWIPVCGRRVVVCERGGSFVWGTCLWVGAVVCGCWVCVRCMFVGGVLLFVGGLFVVCGGGGAVWCVVWLPLARLDGMNVDVVLTMVDNINKNDKQQHHCRSSFVSTSLSATWHLEPPLLLSHRCGAALVW
jgi:hypothetical protein